MKLTKNKLKQIIKEELEEMMSSEPIVVSTDSDRVREVRLSIDGKQVSISFSQKGGSPLVSEEYLNLSDEQKKQVMDTALKAVGYKDDSELKWEKNW